MSRYIDADAIHEKYDKYANHNPFGRGNGKTLAMFLDWLDEQQTADVVEVVHGENISKDGFLCSVCKFGDFDGFHGYEPNFCPNCGADMRGGRNELYKRL